VVKEEDKRILGLELPTDPRWVNIARMNIRDILVDHAYCEQKATSSCISLIVQFPDKGKLVETLTPVVTEEWSHFRDVLAEMKKRGFRLGAQRKDEYVERLQAVLRKGVSREHYLVERLLLNALIEARSCERFRLLAKEIADRDLAGFYYRLMISEAGHYRNFLQLAREYADPDYVEKRWKELLASESEIVRQLEPRADRMH
jgi:tRNA-(ms[2]io[6]A)-hydroxylase